MKNQYIQPLTEVIVMEAAAHVMLGSKNKRSALLGDVNQDAVVDFGSFREGKLKGGLTEINGESDYVPITSKQNNIWSGWDE